ncbi:hypothetical protein [Solilutibacter silvestris]|uniref:hypothetical protein n=1 Tax=Solilutibacter silvestris TaxID=1645665 RepID=UPI003D338A5D
MSKSNAEAAISSKLTELQERIKSLFRGQEKIAVIEIVRTLDYISILELTDAPLSADQRTNNYFARCGAAAALQPVLPLVEEAGEGVPWHSSGEHLATYFYSYLVTCGKLVDLLRLVRLERYGLARTEVALARVDIYVQSDARERRARGISRALRLSQVERADIGVPNTLINRMREYVQKDEAYLIRYDNDWEIVGEYRRRAKRYSRYFLEGEAFPDTFILGGRPFLDWKIACEDALGRILMHADFSFLLCEKHPEISLRDIITVPVRKEDVADIWGESGHNSESVASIMRTLTLHSGDLVGWRDSFEIPTCYYIGIGSDFLLLSSFGALLNPYYSLFRYLRTAYRGDWDRGVDLREGIFRADLRKLFSEERFLVPSHGYKVKREDGSHLTDIDAVVCDRSTGSLALFQLKWHDVYGRSLSERESRRKNLAKAADWVARVSAWIGGKSSREVAAALGLQVACSEAVPELYVIARYGAQFEGDDRDDRDATWLPWAELMALKEADAGKDPLRGIAVAARTTGGDGDGEASSANYGFPGLTVIVHVAGGSMKS